MKTIMKRTMQSGLAAWLILATLIPCKSKAAEDLKAESQEAITNFIKADSSLKKLFDGAAGYAVFPSVAKGGLVVGGAHGKGIVYEKNTAIGEASVSQASIGAQAGGQSFAEVIFFETLAALKHFKEGKFEMSADASAVLAAEGKSKAAKYAQGVYVSTLPKKGLMVEASIGGQKFKYEPFKK
jgi:lipid-binding SYLF domain-containing protein